MSISWSKTTKEITGCLKKKHFLGLCLQEKRFYQSAADVSRFIFKKILNTKFVIKIIVIIAHKNVKNVKHCTV